MGLDFHTGMVYYGRMCGCFLYLWCAGGGAFNVDLVMVAILAWIVIPGFFNFMFYAFLTFDAQDIIVPESHRVTLTESELHSDWTALPLQIRNVGGTRVSLVMPYSAITRIVWNKSMQRLEIYGEYSQKIKTEEGKWENKDVCFFAYKFKKKNKESSIRLYGYFLQMRDLMNQLQTLSGVTIEEKERNKVLC